MELGMNEMKVLQQFKGGIDCSMVVFGAAAPELGLDQETARKIAAGFGGGMGHALTCGCVTGALMALGLKYGNAKAGDRETKQAFLEKKALFEQMFEDENGSLLCKELLELDLTVPEELEKIREKKLMDTLCPKLVCSACKILEELL